MAVGALADVFGLTASFIVPLAAYVFIASFAIAARGEAKTARQPDVVASPIA